MRLIENYIPPSTNDLTDLKGRLHFTGQQMAELAGVSNSNQWRKYTGGEKPRELNQHILFFVAAQLTLDQNELSLILDEMRKLGAEFEENLIQPLITSGNL
ncbi:XRE family transcriptional regulator [Xenorhabdus sp. IM139775]|uniref:XRE family transcriptional regulator n=1 Tax=Xenorhabdus sp. IM139775 TaxID=3025876 RepID=UPI002358AB5A|nr:XRE family transcriptional regulator [Xenorhabdus sp. IM139775]MDC9595115.1 XRE family transcriptional regulator [Xenorhabdus sp. IM139775]